MSDRVIPNWAFRTPNKNVEATGQAPVAHANASAQGSTPPDLSVYALGRDEIIPIVYGGPERMAGLLYIVATPKTGAMGGKLVLASVLCEGPVEDVYGFEVNNGPVPANVSITAYRGDAGNIVDPTLAAAIPGFTETLPGVAYFVAMVSPTDGAFPTITALVKGLKVADSRTTFFHVFSDFTSPNWTAVGVPPPTVVNNTHEARDGSQTAHSIIEATAADDSVVWTWNVPNDTKKRNTSISINKDVVFHDAGVAVEYAGGTAIAFKVRIDLGSGAVSVESGAGTYQVIEHPNHWEVILSLSNNGSGNTQFKLRLYPAI